MTQKLPGKYRKFVYIQKVAQDMQNKKRSRKKRTKAVSPVIWAVALGIILTAASILILRTRKKAEIAAPVFASETEQKTILETPAAEPETETEKETETGTETFAKDLITGTMYVMTNRVNVRKEPSAKSDRLGELMQNAEVSVIAKEGDWVKIVHEGQICYVSAKYLTEDKDWREHFCSSKGYKDGEVVSLDPSWEYAGFSEIHSDSAAMYLAKGERKGITIGVNAGHGTEGGSNVKTWCHPDKSPKVTGGTTAAGETKAVAVSWGMTFRDGTPEAKVTLAEAMILRDLLLENGYDVLMIRETGNAQLDNVARTVICNQAADCHIAIHWDGDGLDYDKGCFYMSVPDGIKYLPSVANTWEKSEKLGDSLIQGLTKTDNKVMGSGCMDMDLTQTSYSTVPSVDIELGNQSSDHSEEKLRKLADGLLKGIDLYFGY